MRFDYSGVGLTSTATINELFAAMPNYSKLICYMSGTDKSAVDLGMAYGGTLEITKHTSYRGWAIATAYEVYLFKIGSVLANNTIYWKTLSVT